MLHRSRVAYFDSRDALYHPERQPVFVNSECVPPFNSKIKTFSLSNAWWLSNASHLAYYKTEDIEYQLSRVGLQLFASFSGSGSRGFVATGSNFAILSFRGTSISETINMKNDIDIRHARLSEGVFVHEGFLRSLKAIWPDAEHALYQLSERNIDVWYTGHSLGAAMATLAAAFKTPAAVYAFGSPRVGNEAFVDSIHDVNLYRLVNCCDAITSLPPKQFGYLDAGKEFFMTSRHRILYEPTRSMRMCEQILGTLRFYMKLPWRQPEALRLRALADHIIVNYSNGILANVMRENHQVACKHPQR